MTQVSDDLKLRVENHFTVGTHERNELSILVAVTSGLLLSANIAGHGRMLGERFAQSIIAAST